MKEKKESLIKSAVSSIVRVFVPMDSFKGSVKTRLDRPWPDARPTYKFGYDDEGGIKELRDRAMYLDRSNVLARTLIDRTVDNVIGEGITIQAATDDESWNTEAEGRFNDWAEESADARRLDSWCELQRLYCRHFVRDGDAAFVLREDGALQLPEPRFLETPPKLSGNTNVVGGIHLVGEEGLPAAFHFYSGVPGKYSEVQARDVVYSRRTTEAGLTRGVPAFATTARDLDQVDGLIEAVISAAEMAAMFGLLLKTDNAQAELGALRTTTPTASGQKRELKLEPGMFKALLPHEDVTQITPQQPSQNLQEFLTTMFRRIGLEFGMPLELVMLDFSKTNYSSARASLLQAQKVFRGMQKRMIHAFKRVYRWRISKFIKEGKLANRPDAWLCRMIAPGWPWVDPVKEGQAMMLGLDGGWLTLADVCASHGRDLVDVFKQRKREIELFGSAGIPILHSTLTREENAAAMAPTTARDEDEV